MIKSMFLFAILCFTIVISQAKDNVKYTFLMYTNDAQNFHKGLNHFLGNYLLAETQLGLSVEATDSNQSVQNVVFDPFHVDYDEVDKTQNFQDIAGVFEDSQQPLTKAVDSLKQLYGLSVICKTFITQQSALSEPNLPKIRK